MNFDKICKSPERKKRALYDSKRSQALSLSAQSPADLTEKELLNCSNIRGKSVDFDLKKSIRSSFRLIGHFDHTRDQSADSARIFESEFYFDPPKNNTAGLQSVDEVSE